MSERLQGSELIVDPVRVAKLRKKARLTQKQLATKIGVTERIVQYWESKTTRKQVTPDNLKNLAAVLGTTGDYLIGAVDIVGEKDVSLAIHKQKILDIFEEMTVSQREAVLEVCDDILKYRKLEV